VGTAIAGMSEARPAPPVQAVGADSPGTEKQAVCAEGAVVVKCVDNGHVEIVHPTAPKVREEVVDVDDVGSKTADRLEGVGAAAGCNPEGRANWVEQTPLEVVGVRGEELDLVAGTSERVVLRLDDRVLAARLA